MRPDSWLVLFVTVSLLLCASSTKSGAESNKSEKTEAFVPPDASLREAVIPLVPLQQNYALPDSFLSRGAEEVRIGNRELESGRDYFLNRTKGELRVISPFQSGDTLTVVYRIVPLQLSMVYGRRPSWKPAIPEVERVDEEALAVASASATQLAAAATGASANPGWAPLPGVASNSDKPQLQISGNKSIIIESGTQQNANLLQSFDLNASGSLGGGVDLVAILSDRSTPITSSGATLDLQELDKILVEVRSPIGAATLGDYTLNANSGQFGLYEREFSGARVRGETGGMRGQVALARAKGRYHSMNFRGEEGRQGPYFLVDEAGNTGVLAVAGSDVVWVDGIRMTRGESADYEIDYLRGTLTFSPRRPISSESRISVDIQLANAAYERIANHLSGGMTRGPVQLYGHAFREYDDTRNPIAQILDANDRLALANAGDDAGQAHGSGIVPGIGDYDQVTGLLGETYYAFAGIDSGGFDLAFLGLGQGEGSYVESTSVLGRRVYQHVGESQGTHSPGRQLNLPQEHLLYGGGGTLEPIKGFRLEGEFARSRVDRNRLSSLDGSDNDGIAARWDLTAEPTLRLGGKNLGRLEILAGMRKLDETFVPVARVDYPFFQEDWGVTAEKKLIGRDTRHASLKYSPVQKLEFGGERARLTSAGGFEADRWSWRGELAGKFAHRIRYDRVDNQDPLAEEAGNNGSGYRNKFMYGTRWQATRYFEPSFDLDYEDLVPPGLDTQALRYRAWNGGLQGKAGILQWNGGIAFRRDFNLAESVWSMRQTAKTIRLETTANFARTLSFTLGGSRRKTDRVQSSDIQSDNGYARIRQGSRGGRFRQDASFEWTAQAIPFRIQELLFVGYGAGGYDSLGQISTGAGYDLRFHDDPDSLDRLTRSVFAYRAIIQPGAPRGGGQASWLADIRSTTTLQSSSSYRGPLTIGNLISPPSWLETQDDVALGSFLIRQEFENVTRQPIEIFARFEHGVLANRQTGSSGQFQKNWSEEGRLRLRRGARWLWELRGRGAQSSLEIDSPIGGLELRSLNTVEAGFEATYISNQRFQISGLANIERFTDHQGNFMQVARIGPHAVYTIGNLLRADGTVRWAPWTEGHFVPTLMPSFVGTRPDWIDFRMDLSYRFRSLANLGFSWFGSARQGGDLIHTARGELRAYF